MRTRVSKQEGRVPLLYCRRQKRSLCMEEHLACEHAVAPVWDENGEPVSLLCMYGEERREFVKYEDIPEGEGGEGD